MFLIKKESVVLYRDFCNVRETCSHTVRNTEKIWFKLIWLTLRHLKKVKDALMFVFLSIPGY